VSITVKILKRAVGGRPTLYATRDLDSLPASIGRDPACSIALEDPNKHMSRFHVQIAEEAGTYWLSVVSKVNPVIVKGVRYGPGARLELHSGDSFVLADYEVQVLLPDPAQPAASETPHPDNAERLFNEATFLGVAPPPSHALRALFEGAGLPPKELTPMQADRMLRDCGAMLRAAVGGIMMLLSARAAVREEFAAEEHDNNPLKLMRDAQEAVAFLFDPAEDRTDGLLDPVQAMGNACSDLRSHELALLAGMRAAVLGALARFDPAAIERELDEGAQGFRLASRKARLWETFVAHQEKLSREAREDFSQAFGRDFIGAYRAELRRLKGGR
jgi:predicted component of type VI protein secretion system